MLADATPIACLIAAAIVANPWCRRIASTRARSSSVSRIGVKRVGIGPALGFSGSRRYPV